MLKFSRILARMICIWILLVIITAALFDKYIVPVVLTGLILFMGSFMIFAVIRVTRFAKGEPLSGMSDPIPSESKIRVTARMTGQTRQAAFSVRGRGTTMYTEYEIEYSVQGKNYVKWFNMFPGPDPGDAYGEGREVRIVCDLKEPGHFEVEEICEESL